MKGSPRRAASQRERSPFLSVLDAVALAVAGALFAARKGEDLAGDGVRDTRGLRLDGELGFLRLAQIELSPRRARAEVELAAVSQAVLEGIDAGAGFHQPDPPAVHGQPCHGPT